MNDITVAINITNHDWGITILKNGKLEDIILEDRTSGIKYKRSFPLTSLYYLKKKYSKINTVIFIIGDNDNVVDNTISELKALQIEYDKLIIADKALHHLYHAFAGFCSSKFNEAVVLSIDGFGGIQIVEDKKLKKMQEGVTSTSIWEISYNKGIEKKYSKIWYLPRMTASLPDWRIKELKDKNDEWSSTPDIGVMYYTIANHLGFQYFHDAGKVMGLSAYGKKNNLPPFLFKNTINCNPAVFLNNFSLNTTYYPEFYYNNNLETAKNLAYSIQKSFEKVILTRVEQALSMSNSNNLIFTGGCALNVLGNYLIKKNFPNINLYIDPISSDANQGLGVAKYNFYNDNGYLPKDPLNSLFLGPSYTKEEILNSIKKYA